MKLLFDQNLSRKLPRILDDFYPESSQVLLIWGGPPSDSVIWNYARDNDFVIVTKDVDYVNLSRQRGFPPKVILILSGNGPTQQVAELLRDNFDLIQRFETDRTTGIIEMG